MLLPDPIIIIEILSPSTQPSIRESWKAISASAATSYDRRGRPEVSSTTIQPDGSIVTRIIREAR